MNYEFRTIPNYELESIRITTYEYSHSYFPHFVSGNGVPASSAQGVS